MQLGMRVKYGKNRLRSVESIYAYCLSQWEKAQKADKAGLLPPNSVDNHVENVDFCIGDSMYMQFRGCIISRPDSEIELTY